MNAAVSNDLPLGNETGPDERDWVLPTRTDQDERVSAGALRVRASFIGMGSTRSDRHQDHNPGEYPVKTRGEKCNLCRWYETRVFRLGENDYVVHHVGRSIVPGEVDMPHHESAYSADEVIELYTVRKDDKDPFLTRPGARALSQAVQFDDELREARRRSAVA